MKILMAGLLLVTTCDAPAPPPAPPQSEKNIYIDQVTAANPVIIRGRACTFENNVALRVRGERGELMAENFTTSTGEMGRHNPFAGEVWLARHPGNQITAEAFEYSAKDGAVRSLDSRKVPYAVDAIIVKLVFPVEDCTRFETFERKVPKTPAMARLLIEALLAGPTDEEKRKGASPPFPKHADVRKVTLVDGVLTVDFNERLQNVGGSCAASVTRTLTLLPTVKRVAITP